MVSNRDEVEVEFYQYSQGYQPINPPRLRMSRLEFEALKLRAVQQKTEDEDKPKPKDSINNADATFTLGGNVYTHEYLDWLLSERHQTGKLPTQQQWAEAKIRQQEYLRKQQEEANRQAQERARQAQEAYYKASQRGFWYTSGTNTGDPFSHMFNEFNRRPKAPNKSNKEKLADLAGVEWQEADNMTLSVLKKRAMRKCHPDTGGSHEKWLELTKLLKVMDIKL